MPPKPQSVSTAADELFELVKAEKEISFKDAAKKLGVPAATIEAWATFLEEDGMLSIKYKLTTPFLTLPVSGKNTGEAKKDIGSGRDKLFLYKVEEAEVRSEFENVSDLLETASARREEGEFGMLGNIESQVLTKLEKIINFIISKLEITPQKKAHYSEEVASIEKSITAAVDLAKKNKFDEANTAYSSVHKRMDQLLKDARQEFQEQKETMAPDEAGIKKLVEKTYELLEAGKAKEAEENYEKIKRMAAKLEMHFSEEKTAIEDDVLKLNRDLAIKTSKIRQQQMSEGMNKISSLLKLAHETIHKKQFNSATAYYLEIKNTFESLPAGFAKEKRRLKESILKVFEQIAKERQNKLKSRFTLLYKSIEDKLKEVDKYLVSGDTRQALSIYRKIGKLYADLPNGFIREKFAIHKKIIALYTVISQRLEISSERTMGMLSENILQLLAAMKQQVSHGKLDDATQTYSRINGFFSRLPEGFIEQKTELQEKIIDAYEELLQRNDAGKETEFNHTVKDIEAMMTSSQESIKKGDYASSYALYRKIKHAYIKLQPLDIVERQNLRNRILSLYRSILVLRNQQTGGIKLPSIPAKKEPAEEIHRRIENLKTQSRATVRLPVLNQ